MFFYGKFLVLFCFSVLSRDEDQEVSYTGLLTLKHKLFLFIERFKQVLIARC